MQTPNSQTPVSRVVSAARFLLAALVQLAETADLAPTLQASFDALVASIAATAAADDATIAPRVGLRFAERSIELTIRLIAVAAKGLDGGKTGGRIATALFPDGLLATIVPQTEEQHAVATQLLHRLGANEIAAPLRSVHEPALRTALDDLRRGIEERTTALDAHDQAFQHELAARDALIRAYDTVANSVRARFPKDRAQQDVFFEILRGPSTPATPDDPTVDAHPTPTS